MDNKTAVSDHPKIETKNLKFWLCILLVMTVCFHLCVIYFISDMRPNFVANFRIFSLNRNQSQSNDNGTDSDAANVLSQSQLTPVNNGTRSKPLKILFWTTWYGTSKAFQKFDGKTWPCKDFPTIVTFNKSEYASVDAVMFQYLDLSTMSRLPSRRNPHIPWILCLQETPINQRWSYGKAFDGIFNYTWSLREESEIPYVIKDMFEPRQVPDEDWKFGSEFSKKFLRRKTKMAAWIVSNFQVVRSKRIEFARKLQDHGVNVTVFNNRYSDGGDSSIFGFPWRHCPMSETCFRDVGLEHKFYFAFENSLCANSKSEKLPRGLVHGMVPIFYGIFNLSSNAPPHSYIDAMEFNSTKELAEYLIYLDKNDEEYFKYFEWRQHYSFGKDDHFQWLFHCIIWRKVRKLKEENHKNIYGDLERWITKFQRKEDGSYCDLCLGKGEIDENNPRATRDKLYRGLNCVK